MTIRELSTLLLFDTTKEQKQKVKDYIATIKKSNKDIFEGFKKSKKYKLLVYSNYLMYKMVANLYKKKEAK